jgi:hypothetical protein
MFIRTSLAAAMLIGLADCFAPVGLGTPSARGLRMVSEAQGKSDAASTPSSDSMVWSMPGRSSEFHPVFFCSIPASCLSCIALHRGITRDVNSCTHMDACRGLFCCSSIPPSSSMGRERVRERVRERQQERERERERDRNIYTSLCRGVSE